MAKLNKSLITMEVLEIPEELTTPEEVDKYYEENVKTHTYVIDDVEGHYAVRVAIAHKKKIRSVDPEFIPEADMYEVSESIQDILKEHGFPVYKTMFPEQEARGPVGGNNMDFTITEQLQTPEIKVQRIEAEAPNLLVEPKKGIPNESD